VIVVASNVTNSLGETPESSRSNSSPIEAVQRWQLSKETARAVYEDAKVGIVIEDVVVTGNRKGVSSNYTKAGLVTPIDIFPEAKRALEKGELQWALPNKALRGVLTSTKTLGKAFIPEPITITWDQLKLLGGGSALAGARLFASYSQIAIAKAAESVAATVLEGATAVGAFLTKISSGASFPFFVLTPELRESVSPGSMRDYGGA
jgi:hypothetical protein